MTEIMESLIGYAEFKYGMPAIWSKIPWNLHVLYISNVCHRYQAFFPMFLQPVILLKFYNAF